MLGPAASVDQIDEDDPLRVAVRTAIKLRTQRSIAKRIGVRAETLNRFLRGKQNLAPKAVLALRDALDGIDKETVQAFSAVPRSPDKLAIIERVDKRLRREMNELRQLLEERGRPTRGE